ncbi:MAG TPA: ATP-dependent DNA helicase RecG [Candidatus Moranbacteria bacterium]|nr:ATP-dependent DNA helicase RecG [Candidatus Moranbacteria bacterium]
MIDLNLQVDKLPKIGLAQAQKLEKLGIKNVRDFLFHFPARYDDLSKIKKISELEPDENTTVSGKIVKFATKRSWQKRMKIIEIILKDDTGEIKAVWFNQDYLIESFSYSYNKEIRLSGKVKLDSKGFSMSNPIWEPVSKTPNHTGRIVPIYPETKGITSRWLRWQIENIFRADFEIADPLPHKILKKYNLPSLKKALYDLHFPTSENKYLVAQKRFAFFDMFLIQLKSLQVKQNLQTKNAQIFKYNKKVTEKFLKSLPFKLTNDQKKAFQEIKKDLAKPHPMNRLLNGDVGSGKTIIAILASLQITSSNSQVALMAPTEVLAYQHFKTFSNFFSKFDTSICLLTASYKIIFKNGIEQKIKRDELLEQIQTGKVDIIIGTHALIQKDVAFKSLSLVIIDEQHRFGVKQRAYLQQQTEGMNDGDTVKISHFLTMTATPIPRTISMTLLGSLDISLISEMPKNRKPIMTSIVVPKKTNQVYEFIRQQVNNGYQCFVVLPLVEESEKLVDLKAVLTEHERLSKEIFPEFKLGLLHGKMKSAEKEKIMEEFAKNKINILVSTSVIEVGIDIPNATTMIIEDAYRFGLSQLHQFRGRIGRGQKQSYCFLFSKQPTKRLRVIADNLSGFKIAEEDLKLRGPGSFLGVRQSGLADATMQNITNIKMIKAANADAKNIIKTDPNLTKHPLLSQTLEKMNQEIHLE